MKVKILLKIFITLSLFLLPTLTFAVDNLKVWDGNWWVNNRKTNLEILKDWNNFFSVSTTWEKGIRNLMFNIARDIRIVMFVIVLIIWMIMAYKVIFSSNTEEEMTKFKKWFVWATLWLMVFQLPFSFYSIFFDKDVDSSLAMNFKTKMIVPFTNLLMLLASFVFIAMAIYAFYRIVTANWDEEKVKKWRNVIFQSIAWFLVIKIASTLVNNTLSVWCSTWLWVTSNCTQNITKNAEIITELINWLNTFVWIAVVISVMYAWFLNMVWAWDDDKKKKSKNIFIFSWLWTGLLFVNYLILTFFIYPESGI